MVWLNTYLKYNYIKIFISVQEFQKEFFIFLTLCLDAIVERNMVLERLSIRG